MATPAEVELGGIRATRAERRPRCDRGQCTGAAGCRSPKRPGSWPSSRPTGTVTARLGGARRFECRRRLLGVATVSEGQVLRAHAFMAPIVLLGSIDAAEAPAACEAGLEITVAGEWLLESVQRAARAAFASSPIAVHLKVDTGLRRYGAASSEAVCPCRPRSRATHIFALPASHAFRLGGRTGRAVHGGISFRNSTTWLTPSRGAGVRLQPRHAANSAGILTGQGLTYAWHAPESHSTASRPRSSAIVAGDAAA